MALMVMVDERIGDGLLLAARNIISEFSHILKIRYSVYLRSLRSGYIMTRSYLFPVMLLFHFQGGTSAELLEIKPPNVTPTWADIQRGEILIDGEIHQGDFNKIIEYLKSRPELPSGFSIRSTGGDIIESRMIGGLFRDTLLSIYVMEYCYSACFYILSASSNRIVPDSAQIGIHSPRYYEENFTGLSAEEAHIRFQKIQSSTESFLKETGVPLNIIEKMFSIPFDDLYLLNAQEKQFLNTEPHAVEEWIRVKCNLLTPGEYSDLNKRSFVDRYTNPDRPPMGISAGYWSYLMQKNAYATECLAKIKHDRLRTVLDQYKQGQL